MGRVEPGAHPFVKHRVGHTEAGAPGAKRCVWHPRWLINRAASKLASRQLRSYFLSNPWNIYARRVAEPPILRLP